MTESTTEAYVTSETHAGIPQLNFAIRKVILCQQSS